MQLICANCGGTRTRLVRDGKFSLELALWLLMTGVGIIYTLIRLATLHRVCRTCDSRDALLLRRSIRHLETYHADQVR